MSLFNWIDWAELGALRYFFGNCEVMLPNFWGYDFKFLRLVFQIFEVMFSNFWGYVSKFFIPKIIAL